MIKNCSVDKPIDYLMYIGDDPQNEKAFNYVQQLSQKKVWNKHLTSNAAIYACTIGRKVTQANYYLSSTDAVLQLLQKLPKQNRQSQGTPVAHQSQRLLNIERRVKSFNTLQSTFNFRKQTTKDLDESIEKPTNNKTPQFLTELEDQKKNLVDKPRLSEQLDAFVDKMCLSDDAEEESQNSEDPRLIK